MHYWFLTLFPTLYHPAVVPVAGFGWHRSGSQYRPISVRTVHLCVSQLPAQSRTFHSSHTFLGKIPLLRFGVDHQVNMWVMPCVVKGSIPLKIRYRDFVCFGNSGHISSDEGFPGFSIIVSYTVEKHMERAAIHLIKRRRFSRI